MRERGEREEREKEECAPLHLTAWSLPLCLPSLPSSPPLPGGGGGGGRGAVLVEGEGGREQARGREQEGAEERE